MSSSPRFSPVLNSKSKSRRSCTPMSEKMPRTRLFMDEDLKTDIEPKNLMQVSFARIYILRIFWFLSKEIIHKKWWPRERLFNRGYSVMWGMFGTVWGYQHQYCGRIPLSVLLGGIIGTLEYVQYCERIPSVLWRIFSNLEWYHLSCGGCSVLWKDTISTVEDVQYF